MKIHYDKNLLLKATAFEYGIIFLVSACSVDSREYQWVFYLGIIVSLVWFLIFAVANDLIQ